MLVRRMSAFYSLFLGISILAIWPFRIYSWEVPELIIQPHQFVYHLGAEMVTALALIAGAIGLFKKRRWGLRLNLAACGMLFYMMIMEAGCYLQGSDTEWFYLSISLAIFTAVAIALNLRRLDDPGL